MISGRIAMRKLALACTALAGLLGAPARADDITQDRLLNADKERGNWLLHHRTYSANRFSPLNQINRDTVKGLKVAWTMALGGVEGGGIWSHGGLEGTPIVENGMMYVTDGWGSVYKIDARNGQGKLLWKMDPKTDHDWAGAVACCGVDNRGVALWVEDGDREAALQQGIGGGDAGDAGADDGDVMHGDSSGQR